MMKKTTFGAVLAFLFAAAGALKQIVLFALRDALRRPVLVRHVGIARFVGGKRERRGHHKRKKKRRQARCDLFHW